MESGQTVTLSFQDESGGVGVWGLYWGVGLEYVGG